MTIEKPTKTYVTTKAFGGLVIPPPLQILQIKEYCKSLQFQFSLPYEEFIFDGCYMELYSLLSNLEGVDAIIMNSMFMLPSDIYQRQSIYELCMSSGVELHFILEKKIVRSLQDILSVEEVYKITNTLKFCPKKIPMYEEDLCDI